MLFFILMVGEGMQGDDYVSFDVGKVFLKEWHNLVHSVLNKVSIPKQREKKNVQKHKKYRAIKKPSADCLDCWFDYLEKHADKKSIKNIDLLKLMKCLAKVIEIANGTSISAAQDADIALGLANGWIRR